MHLDLGIFFLAGVTGLGPVVILPSAAVAAYIPAGLVNLIAVTAAYVALSPRVTMMADVIHLDACHGFAVASAAAVGPGPGRR